MFDHCTMRMLAEPWQATLSLDFQVGMTVWLTKAYVDLEGIGGLKLKQPSTDVLDFMVMAVQKMNGTLECDIRLTQVPQLCHCQRYETCGTLR